MIQEIEVKARAQNNRELLQALSDMGIVLSEEIVQKDDVFLPEGIGYPVPLGTLVLRLREQQGRIIFTLKQPLKNELDCIERETVVGDKQLMTDIIERLGFYRVLQIYKTRQKAKYKQYEICVDTVKYLGNFIEVEKMSSEDAVTVQEELFAFLETLGVEKSDQVFHGYDTLIYNWKHAKAAKNLG